MSAQTIAKLRAHAAGSGPEAEIARSVLAGMGESPEAADEICLDCATDGSWHQAALFMRICGYLDCGSFKYMKNPRKWQARGPQSMCEAAVKLFATMKVRLAELHRGTTIGFMVGALPVPDNPNGKPCKPLDRDSLAAAHAAMNIGARNNPPPSTWRKQWVKN